MPKYQFGSQPYDHQIKALKKGWDKEFFAYFMEMGTGKTKTVLDNAGILLNQNEINFMLILAPKSVYKNWINEIKIHLPENIQKDLNIGVLKLPLSKKNLKELKIIHDSSRFSILLINIEALISKNVQKIFEEFLAEKETLLVIDESTKIKNLSSKRTKYLIETAHLAKYRRILSGSPIVNTAMNIYSQFEFLKKGLLSKTEVGFRNLYCVTRDISINSFSKNGHAISFSKKIIVGSKNIEMLYDNIEPYSYRVKKSECLDLPEKIYSTREVEMSPEQKKLYAELRDQAYSEFEDEEVSVSLAITKLLALHQVVCGYVKTDDGEIHDIKNNRLDVLLDLIDEIEGKIIIWANYIKNIDDIYEALQKRARNNKPLGVYRVTGSTPLEARENAYTAIEKGGARVLLTNAQTSGHGITLTSVNTHIYYSNNYDLELRIQSEDRSHRIGQRQTVNYIDLVCPGTVDETILRALKSKITLSSAILKDGPSKWVI